MRISLVALAAALLVLAIGGCSSADRQKAKEQAREDLRKSREEAKRAGQEISKDAKDFKTRVDAAVKPDKVSASEKLSQAEETAKTSASEAGVKLSHAALLAKVKTKLASDAGVSTVTDINVTLDGSVVTLSGSVSSIDQKNAAERAASEVDGVTKVRNQLTVKP